MDFLYYNSIKNVPDPEDGDEFTVNSETAYNENVDIVPTVMKDSLSYIHGAT